MHRLTRYAIRCRLRCDAAATRVAGTCHWHGFRHVEKRAPRPSKREEREDEPLHACLSGFPISTCERRDFLFVKRIRIALGSPLTKEIDMAGKSALAIERMWQSRGAR